jgi:hypothetical protein
MNASQKSLQPSADPYTRLLENYMLVDRRFHHDEQVCNFLKSEIWSGIEQNRIDETLATVTAAIESNGATVVEAAEIYFYKQKEKRAQRRVGP